MIEKKYETPDDGMMFVKHPSEKYPQFVVLERLPSIGTIETYIGVIEKVIDNFGMHEDEDGIKMKLRYLLTPIVSSSIPFSGKYKGLNVEGHVAGVGAISVDYIGICITSVIDKGIY